MDFLHADFWGNPKDTAMVTLDCQANVMLLDDTNFASYKQGRSFNYFGGWTTCSRVKLHPPHYGHWHVVIDLGGSVGRIRASVRIMHSIEQEVLF